MNKQTIDSKIEDLGNGIKVGEGDAGLQMFVDTMRLAINKTLKTGHTFRAITSSLISVGLGYFAFKNQSIYLAFASGAVTSYAIPQILNAIETSKTYAKTQKDAISHGHGTIEELKKINHRYL